MDAAATQELHAIRQAFDEERRQMQALEQDMERRWEHIKQLNRRLTALEARALEEEGRGADGIAHGGRSFSSASLDARRYESAQPSTPLASGRFERVQPRTSQDVSTKERRMPSLQGNRSNVRQTETSPAAGTQAFLQTLMRDYNALAAQQGFAAMTAQNAFIEQYHVRPLACANYEARMTDPSVPAVFESAGAPQDSSLWAILFGGDVYAVLPQSGLVYDSAYHSAGAFGEIFASGYTAGSYETVTVTKPAFFHCTNGRWMLAQKGALRLA